MGFAETYHYLMDEISDPRSADWPLIGSPVPVMVILVVYLAFVLRFGPMYMKDRKPFSLKPIMICYNAAAMIGNAVLFYGLFKSGFRTTLRWGCVPLEHSYDVESLSMARYVWWCFISKIFELTDTVMFVLRKKYNQASFLHVYHHVMTVVLTWIACKYAPGGMWTFNLIPNCAVHVVMYGYYLLCCFGANMQKLVAPWKQYITILQLIQFGVMSIYTLQAFAPSCEPTRKPLAFIYISQIFTMVYLFCDYYRKSYRKKKTE